MTYTATIGTQTVYVENRGTQTLITLSSQTPGQQQSQSSSLTTGEWTAVPALFRSTTGAIVRIQTAQGQWFIQLQANGMQSLTQPPDLENAETIPMQPQEASPSSQPMPPMSPMNMKPMKMGDMEMQMNPMQMRMGNMEMRMGEARANTSSTRQFCTQCGNAVAPTDKFCAQCGHSLQGGIR
jgi:hypothetical protein